MASVGFMVGAAGGDLSLGSVLGVTTFFLLGAGMFVGTFNLSRRWEDEQT